MWRSMVKSQLTHCAGPVPVVWVCGETENPHLSVTDLQALRTQSSAAGMNRLAMFSGPHICAFKGSRKCHELADNNCTISQCCTTHNLALARRNCLSYSCQRAHVELLNAECAFEQREAATGPVVASKARESSPDVDTRVILQRGQ